MKTQSAATSTSRPSHQEIRELAYKLWQLADSPSGFDLTFWLHAEQQILSSLLEPQRQPSASDEQPRPSEIKTAPVKSKAASSAKRATRSPAVSPTRETRKAPPFTRSGGAGLRRIPPIAMHRNLQP